MVIMQMTAVYSTPLVQASSMHPPSPQQTLWVVGSTSLTGLFSSPRTASTSVSLVAHTHTSYSVDYFLLLLQALQCRMFQ